MFLISHGEAVNSITIPTITVELELYESFLIYPDKIGIDTPQKITLSPGMVRLVSPTNSG